MATYTPTIITTALQEKGLALELARTNAERAAKKPPLPPIPSVGALLAATIATILNTLGGRYKREVRHRLSTAADTATNTQLANAATALGVTLP